MSFEKAMAFLHPNEGGASSDRHDNAAVGPPGSVHTYRGITRRDHPKWPGWEFVDAGNFAEADKHVDALYREEYWLPAHCNEMPEPIDQVVFDGAVHSSPKRSVQWLQQAVDAFPDGDFGPRTRAAMEREVERYGAEAVALETLGIRAAFMVGGFRRGTFSPQDPLRYLKGFWMRTLKLAYEVGDLENKKDT